MSSSYSYQCVGLISGSSLDGLDLVHAQLEINPDSDNPITSWSLIKGSTVPYPVDIVQRLKSLPLGTAIDLIEMDNVLGQFFGEAVNDFIDNKDEIHFISNHGHTVFHDPGRSSTQIGNCAIIAAVTDLQTIGHLRNMDTAYGGQGAPLAPMADLYLLSEHDICVNIGGIANLSIKESSGIIGFDVCGANQFLNHLAGQVGLEYDDGGQLARSGEVDAAILSNLNNLPYCQQDAPKSLDNEQVRTMYLPILTQSSAMLNDQMATMVEHIAIQITKHIQPQHGSIHLAGGGTHNTFLVERIRAHCHSDIKIVVPSADIINFKEAILIAMCGGLRLLGLPNCLKSITGASKNTVNGVVFLP